MGLGGEGELGRILRDRLVLELRWLHDFDLCSMVFGTNGLDGQDCKFT